MLTVTCPRCSKAMPLRSAYCRRCGLKLDSAADMPRPIHAGPPERRLVEDPRRWPRVVFVAVVLLVLGLAAVVAMHRARSKTAVSENAEQQADLPQHGPSYGALRPPTPPELPPLPPFSRRLPDDLPAVGTLPADRDFRGRMLTQDRYIEEDMTGSIFAGCHLLQVSFEKASLKRSDFRGAEFLQTTLAGADLEGARFDGAKLSQSHFVSLDTGAVSGRTQVRNGIVEPVPAPPLHVRNAGRATFRGTRFDGIDLGSVDLRGGDFRGASFDGGSLRETDFRGADLREARFRLNDFAGARLDEADLRGADLSSARNLSEAQLASAKTDEKTRRPRR